MVVRLSGELQASKGKDDNGLNIKGSDYCKDGFTPPVDEVSSIDEKDKKTPDDWVIRHPDMIRLTGRHPFNSEPPPRKLYEYGFITPTSLHYVRDHAAVPKIDIQEHKVSIGGLVEKPMELSMDFLRGGTFKEVTLPVTMVCCGNRRKEMNTIKKTLGFNWGSAGTATSLWTGVWLRDVLDHVGIKSVEDGALHIRYSGADKPSQGTYATSISRTYAMDPLNDVMLAYKCNGEELRPDHGYPVRMLVPGYIGGRSVKWLKEITVSSAEDDSYYHTHDNKVLPQKVSSGEMAEEKKWWYRPEYICNELNINSAIIYPAHDEVVPISGPSAKERYTVKGYAYAGGGLPINRVEVTLDDGKNWELATIHAPEKPRPGAKHWCWVFWEVDIDVAQLIASKEISCRAWQGQNTQPREHTWNLLGMMNNSHYVCRIHPVRENGDFGLHFEHPVQAGALPGGWMEAQSQEASPAPAPTEKGDKGEQAPKEGKALSQEEVEKHDSDKDCWIILEKKVYDVTRFLGDHPGGADAILLNAGQDATDEFNSIHSQNARNMLKDYYIGYLGDPSDNSEKENKEKKTEDTQSKQEDNADKSKDGAKSGGGDLVALSKKKVTLKLAKREELTHDTRRFRFALPSENHTLGLPCGKHIMMSGKWKGEFVTRPYTPITGDEVKGYVEFAIKVYYPCEPKFPEGGKMSQLLDSLKIGDTIDFKGPLGEVNYLENGNFTYKGKRKYCQMLGMIAGGTGITPMYQVAQHILRNPEDKTKVSLLFANKTDDDILLKAELDELAAKHAGQFSVEYVIDKAVKDKNWKGSLGHINDEMIRAHLPGPSDDTAVFLCGPPPMIEKACIPNLKKEGHSEDNIVTF